MPGPDNSAHPTEPQRVGEDPGRPSRPGLRSLHLPRPAGRVQNRFSTRGPTLCKSASRNMESAQLHPDVVSKYLQKEGSLGRMLGPFAQGELVAQCHISRFGVIPKGHGTGKFRLITDLSFPPAGSVNDDIESDLCSLTYTYHSGGSSGSSSNHWQGRLASKNRHRGSVSAGTGTVYCRHHIGMATTTLILCCHLDYAQQRRYSMHLLTHYTGI